MATKNFRSTVLEPTSEFAHGDKLRFTALATIGEVLKGSFSEVTIGEDGVYSVDLQYGKHRVDYKPYEGVWRHFADVEVNADTLATTLQDLSLASVPVTDETILVLQGILADAEVVKTESSAIRDEAEAAAAEAAASAASALDLLNNNRNIYVSKSGNDTTGDGTSSKPFATISKAVASTNTWDNVIVNLSGATTKESAHVIGATIDISSRTVRLQSVEDSHISVTTATAFSSYHGGMLAIYSGSKPFYFHFAADGTILDVKGESYLHLGNAAKLYIRSPDSAKISLTATSLAAPNGMCRLSGYYVFAQNQDGSAESKSNIIAVNGLYVSSTMCTFYQCSMGENFNYSNVESRIVDINTGTKMVTI